MISSEAKIGLMVISGIVLLVMAILLLGSFQIHKGWRIEVLYDNIADLKLKAPVKVAGVDVGYVDKIELLGNKAKITIFLQQGVELHEDAQVRMATEGYIGRRYLEITPGSPELPLLKGHDRIVGTQPVDYTRMLSSALDNFSQSMETLKLLNATEGMGQNLDEILKNLQGITSRLNRFLTLRENDLNQSIENLKEFSQSLNRTSRRLEGIVTDENKELLESTLRNINAVSQKLDTILKGVEPEPKTVKEKLKRKAFFHFLKKKKKGQEK